MAKPNQTASDWNTFRGMSSTEKTNLMYMYLVQGYNMSEAADIYYSNGNPQYSQYVSLIHRCYNFDSKGASNKGRFSEKRFGYEVTMDDIAAFVRKYPDGINADYSISPGTGIEMENFLKERLSKRTASNRNMNRNTPNMQSGYNQSIYNSGSSGNGVLNNTSYKPATSQRSYPTSSSSYTQNNNNIETNEIFGNEK